MSSATWDRYRKISVLATPLVGAMISQNILNLVDSWMVGHIGTAALAATAAGGILNWLCSTPVMSLSTGVQQISARRFGEGAEDSALGLNAGLLLSLIISIPAAIILHLLTPQLISFISVAPEVLEHGVPYLGTMVLGLPFLGLNWCFRGYWNGINRQKVYMATLLVIHSCNIFLDWVLIFGKFGFQPMGTRGAAIASVISLGVGTLIYFIIALKQLRHQGFLQRFNLSENLTPLIRLSIPNAIQQFLYSLSYNTLYKIIAMLGTAELAAAGIIINFALVCYLPGMALGLVATSLVGQAIGRKNCDDAAEWARQVATSAALLLGALSIPILIFPEWLLLQFLRTPADAAIAVDALRIMAVSLAFEGAAMAYMHALLGAGDSRRVLIISALAQWAFYIPLGWWLGLEAGWGLKGIWVANLLTQFVLFGLYLYYWKSERWRTISI